MIVCDSCDEDFHQSIVRGGIQVKTWRGRAPALICRTCTPVVTAALLLIATNEVFLLDRAEPSETFRNFTLRKKSRDQGVEPWELCKP